MDNTMNIQPMCLSVELTERKGHTNDEQLAVEVGSQANEQEASQLSSGWIS